MSHFEKTTENDLNLEDYIKIGYSNFTKSIKKLPNVKIITRIEISEKEAKNIFF